MEVREGIVLGQPEEEPVEGQVAAAVATAEAMLEAASLRLQNFLNCERRGS